MDFGAEVCQRAHRVESKIDIGACIGFLLFKSELVGIDGTEQKIMRCLRGIYCDQGSGEKCQDKENIEECGNLIHYISMHLSIAWHKVPNDHSLYELVKLGYDPVKMGVRIGRASFSVRDLDDALDLGSAYKLAMENAKKITSQVASSV